MGLDLGWNNNVIFRFLLGADRAKFPEEVVELFTFFNKAAELRQFSNNAGSFVNNLLYTHLLL